MSEPEAAAEARRWLRSAREDLQVVRIALGEDPAPCRSYCVEIPHRNVSMNMERYVFWFPR